jgi:hypothetical protein
MEFKPGDVQLVHNHTMLHDRTASWTGPSRSAPPSAASVAGGRDARPLPEVFAQRYGTVTVGDRGGIIVRGTKLHAPLERLSGSDRWLTRPRSSLSEGRRKRPL